MSVKRNQVIITALVIMIVVAGYLNYVDSKKPGDTKLSNNEEIQNGGKVVLDQSGQEVMVVSADNNGKDIVDGEIGIALTYDEGENKESNISPISLNELDEIAEGEGENENSDPVVDEESEDGTAVFVNNSNDSSFFIQAKLEREQSRAKEKETLTDLINNQNIDKDQKSECANSMLDIQQRIEKETATEALIEAKGFTEAYVRIDENGVDVVVSKTVLSDAEIAQIEDIVKRKTGFDTDKIKVAPLKID